jgi:putative solute:sodium symporter small subunit
VLPFVVSKTGTRPVEPRQRGDAALKGFAFPLERSKPALTQPGLTEEMQAMPQSADHKAREVAHWRKTSHLMFAHLGVWFFFGFIIHMFVEQLNKITIPVLNFPLGFYMAAQGSLIVFVVMLFLFARQQNKIDREFGFAEDD